MDKTTTNPFAKLLKALSKVEQHEVRATAISFSLVMILMASYYILRPVRDAMASDWSDAEVSLLWTINFFFSFAIVAFYGFAASRVSLNRLVPGVFSFFALTFVIFYLVSHLITNTTLIDKAFYVWVSVYSLFPISVFWSFMADIYRREQSKRLFGIITTGASVGAMIGPSVALLFANLGTYNLLLVATVVLLMTLPLVIYLRRIDFTSQSADASPSGNFKPLSKDALAGFKQFFSNPFLIAIGIFLFLYTGIGSFIYFELKNLMAEFSREQRTEIWAFIDLTTNSITIIAGLFITSRLATRLGLGFTLALLPLVVFAGLLSVAMVPLLSVVIGLQIFRRGGNYAITRPAREMLFTYVDKDTRYKSKQVIDIIVYRGGDVFWGWAFTFLTAVIGLGVAGVALVGAGIAALWAMLGLYLGKCTNTLDNKQRAD